MSKSGIIRRVAIAVAVLAVLVAATTFLPGQIDFRRTAPEAADGSIDLSGWDFEEDGNVRLNGVWEFYWQALLEPEDFAAGGPPSAPILAEVPNVWTVHEAGGKPLPGFGYGTYRLRVNIGEVNAGKRLGLYLPDVSTSCKVFVDGKPAASCGVPADNPEDAKARLMPQTVGFEPESPQFDIIVQIANYTYDRGGLWYVPDIGTERQIRMERGNELAIQLILFGIFLFTGMYHIGLYLLRREERAALFFAFGCLIGAVRLLFVGDMYILNFVPELPISAIVAFRYFTYYGGALVLILYLRQLYPREYPRWIAAATAVVSSAFMLSVVAAPLHISTHVIRYFHFYMAFLGIVIIAGIVLAVKRRRDGARLQLFGLAVFLTAIFHDVLYNMYYITAFVNRSNVSLQFLQRQMMQFGLIVIVLTQAIVLVRRYAKAFRTIKQMSEKLIALDRMKDEFLANTSHELQTPLHGIINMSQSMLEGSMGPVTPAHRHNLSVIVSVARRMTGLIRDILDYSRLKHGEIRLKPKPVSLQGVLIANLEVFRHLIGDKPIRLTLDVPDDLPHVHADEDRLLQIVYNLIGNAIKFTESGEIRIAARQRGDFVETTIRDTGIGIAAENHERIFQSFEQVGRSLSREYGGTGLGLPIVRRLVELSGGSIRVDSRPGEGAAFTFTLPLGREDVIEDEEAADAGRIREAAEPFLAEKIPAEAEPQLRTPHVLPDTNEGFTVLAVDDDHANLQVIRSVLAQEPYRIITAANGGQALELVEQHRDIDLVILDVMMPRMSGYEVCARIRERYSLFELPVLLVTVKNEPEDLMSGFAAGANDYLVKPFFSHELRSRTRTLIELKKSVEQAIRSETAFLRAQIKPHFLYNTLTTIISLCKRDPAKAAGLLTELSVYLRGSFDFDDEERHVPLEDELRLVKAYLTIEQARFGGRIAAELDVDPDAQGFVPPLCIQPLVENAVRHGILKRMEGGKVRITVRSDGSSIIISVEDNGIGIPRDRLEELISGQSKGVGVRNIELRLRRFYGRGLEIESEEGLGTRVTMTIPAQPA